MSNWFGNTAASGPEPGTLQWYIYAIGEFINDTLIPLILAVALLVFLFNTARYFIISGSEEGSRARARQLALYAIFAFVLIVSIWGIVNMIVGGLRLNYDGPVVPDYIEEDSSWKNPSPSSGWRGGGSNGQNTRYDVNEWRLEAEIRI